MIPGIRYCCSPWVWPCRRVYIYLYRLNLPVFLYNVLLYVVYLLLHTRYLVFLLTAAVYSCTWYLSPSDGYCGLRYLCGVSLRDLCRETLVVDPRLFSRAGQTRPTRSGISRASSPNPTGRAEFANLKISRAGRAGPSEARDLRISRGGFGR